MTNQQILAIQSYILACVKHEAAHYLEKSESLITMINAQNRMHELLLDPPVATSTVTGEQKRETL